MGAPSIASTARTSRTSKSAKSSSTSRPRSPRKKRWTNKPSTFGEHVSDAFLGKPKTATGSVGDFFTKSATKLHLKKKPKTWTETGEETVTTVADWTTWAVRGIWDTLAYCIPTIFTGTMTTLASATGSVRKAYVQSSGLQSRSIAERKALDTDSEEEYDPDSEAEPEEVTGCTTEESGPARVVIRSARRIQSPETSEGFEQREMITGGGRTGKGTGSRPASWQESDWTDGRGDERNTFTVTREEYGSDVEPFHQVSPHRRVSNSHEPSKFSGKATGNDYFEDSGYDSDSYGAAPHPVSSRRSPTPAVYWGPPADDE